MSLPTWPASIRLADLLEQVARGESSSGWLFLPANWRKWDANTLAYIVDDEHMSQTEDEPTLRGYEGVAEPAALEDILRGASRLLNVRSFAGWLEALVYYYRFDGFLPRIGAPDPPTGPAALLAVDRDFYDSLGDERSDVPCRTVGCSRGAVQLSVLCKVHHFEQVRRRPCPFND